MGASDTFYLGITPKGYDLSTNTLRVCLADVPSALFSSRMTSWLDTMIRDSDFATMNANGVKVVRVPTGYWNWVSLPDGVTPNGSDRDRMLNLQTLSPQQYRPYLDRVFQYAAKYGIQVLLDLHGLPGSQNGEMHSGLCPQFAEAPQFDTEWNVEVALMAVTAMSEYGLSYGATLFGIQVINEPNHYPSDVHSFLDSFYTRAIAAARAAGLPLEVPVIVFSWTYDFIKWSVNHYGDYATFGAVLWDTHIYHVSPYKTIEDAMQGYWPDLTLLQNFHANQNNTAYVGEWSLAGPSFNASTNQALASWLVWCFGERSRGSFFWNFDAPIPEWSLVGSSQAFSINWSTIPKP